MKAIIVYYSLEGNTDYAAKLLAKELEADMLRIEPVTPYPTDNKKFFAGGKDATLGIEPPLKPYSFNADDYDTIILGTPLWAWTYAPPLKTFISGNTFTGKKLAFFVSSGGGSDKKCFAKLRKATGCENAPTLSLTEPLKNKSGENAEKIREFAEKIRAMK